MASLLVSTGVDPLFPHPNRDNQRPIAISTLDNFLRFILQRLPLCLHIGACLLLLLGPFFFPIGFALYYVFINFSLVMFSGRTALGVFFAWRNSLKHSYTDWSTYATAGATDATVDHHADSRSLPDASSLQIEDIFHVIIIPNYKEDVNTLMETLDVLASHHRAKTNYKVWI